MARGGGHGARVGGREAAVVAWFRRAIGKAARDPQLKLGAKGSPLKRAKQRRIRLLHEDHRMVTIEGVG